MTTKPFTGDFSTAQTTTSRSVVGSLWPSESSRALATRLGVIAFGVLLGGMGITGVTEATGATEATPATPTVAATGTAASAPAKPAPGAGKPRVVAVSADTQALLDWVRTTGDNRRQPFAIIDKKRATLQVFDVSGALLGSSPVLLGLAIGDDSVPGIGERKMSEILPKERTTPAGRFDSEPGVNLQGEDIVWVDYDAAISMHRVRTSNPADRRLERLASAKPADHRISYGCINVPAAFYDAWVKPVFGVKPGVVYVLPETRSAQSVFGGPATAR